MAKAFLGLPPRIALLPSRPMTRYVTSERRRSLLRAVSGPIYFPPFLKGKTISGTLRKVAAKISLDIAHDIGRFSSSCLRGSPRGHCLLFRVRQPAPFT